MNHQRIAKISGATVAFWCLSISHQSIVRAQNGTVPTAPMTSLPTNVAAPLTTLAKDSDEIVGAFRVRDEAEFFGLLNLEAPDMAAVKAAVTAKNWPQAKVAWARHLENRTNPQWLWSHRDREAIRRILDEKGQSLTKTIPAADKVLLRQFNFVGIAKTLDKAPQWNQGVNDWTSVLNRFYYALDLGRAYWASGDKKYAEDFTFLIQDWIAKNPVPADVETFGVFGNPWRALEDGLRVQNWLEGMQLFMDAPQFDAEAKYQMTRSLVEHARYMRAVTIKKGYRPGNWQVIEMTGLSGIGIMFPEFRESAQWRAHGFQTLVMQMQKSVYPDGAMSELTPGYHMTVADQFRKATLLSQKNGYQVPGLMDRHEKMYEFLLALSKPDRVSPPIADAGLLGIEGFMADGALLYNRPDMRFLSGKTGPANWVWSFGPDAFARYAQITPQPPSFTSVLLPDSKYSVMRTGWGENDKYLLFDMAPWGGGHSHQDRLQLHLHAGRDLLVDPGQYSYDQPKALYFRSSAAHNIIMIDGQEQINANPTVEAWQTTQNADFASGRIEAKGLSHQRSVLFLKPNYWIVVDRVEMSGAAAATPHEITRLFHFPVTTAQVIANNARTGFAQGMNLQVQAVDGSVPEIRQGWIAEGTATANEAPVAAFVTKSQLPVTLVTVLSPYSNIRELPRVETLPDANSQVTRLRLTFADGQQDEVAIATGKAPLQIGTTRGTGRAIYVRRGPQGNASAILGDGIGPLRLTSKPARQ